MFLCSNPIGSQKQGASGGRDAGSRTQQGEVGLQPLSRVQQQLLSVLDAALRQQLSLQPDLVLLLF